MSVKNNSLTSEKISFQDFKNEVLNDYKTAVISRECSVLGRKEVLTGKAKFGIFGGGKEIPQLAMAKSFKKGDFRAGYYRDQTFMMAIGELTPLQFFAALYAHADIEFEPASTGRQMNNHFGTHFLNEDGSWKKLTELNNITSDISCTAGQMPRLLGLAYASKMYRNYDLINNRTNFTNNGNEVAWGTIGNASTSEGHFFETFNAAGVLQVPMIISVWDDAYGISVPAKYQTTKENISEILKGFQRDEKGAGYELFRVKGWDYMQLIETYEKASKIAREEHVPVLIHVEDLTQAMGHSTSGSHERYKTNERLAWEDEIDCIKQMRNWMLQLEFPSKDGKTTKFATEEEISKIDEEAKNIVKEAKNEARNNFLNPIRAEQKELVLLLNEVAKQSKNQNEITKIIQILASIKDPERKNLISTARKITRLISSEEFSSKHTLQNWIVNFKEKYQHLYSAHFQNDFDSKATNIKEIKPIYNDNDTPQSAYVVLKSNFDAILSKHDDVFIFGEDSGNIGDVNQGLVGLQEKYSELRVTDTGIRETTIIGQGIGMAMRGLRPIAEIQYLDYALYALQVMSDDLATLRYRSGGRQKAPLIVRTRGHRLEGIWHSGSPMGGMIHLLRGMHVLVPRNMTKAAGFYNTLLESDEPAMVVENLNGYRLKEKMPLNLGEFRTPIGVVETIKQGKDITVVSYGSTLRIVEQAVEELAANGIDVELIDIQSLLPFDINHDISKSIQKTNRLLVVDEDVPGGASSYILQQIIEVQNAYQYLDSKPATLTAQPHRAAYGDDGDYFSKPNAEDIFEKVYEIMREANPTKFKKLY